MKKINIKSAWRATKKLFKDNEASITSKAGLIFVLAGAGVGIYAAVRCTKKVLTADPDECICKECGEKMEATTISMYNHLRNIHPSINTEDAMSYPEDFFKMKHSTRQIVKLCWKESIPPIAMMGLGTYGILRSDKMMLNDISTLSTALQLKDTVMADYRDEVKKELGDEKEQEVYKKAKIDDGYKTWLDELDPIDTGHGTDVFYLPWDDRYFLSDYNYLRDQTLTVSEKIFGEDEASLNDWLTTIDYPTKPYVGEDYGWNSDSQKHLMFRPASKIVNGRAVMIVSFNNPPERGWSHWMLGK